MTRRGLGDREGPRGEPQSLAHLDFDPVLLSQARLGIVTVLVTRPEATFSNLKDLLGLTQGNLGIHLGKLEEAGYVAITKEFVRKKPRTTARITPGGRKAFLAHVDRLASVARRVHG